MNMTILMLVLILIIPMGIILTFIPILTRKTESFGVSIEAKHHDLPAIQSMRKSFMVWMGFGTLAIAAISIALAAIVDEEAIGWLLPVLTSLVLVLHTTLYLRFHFRMKKFKKEHGLLSSEVVQKVVVDTSFHQKKRVFSSLWLLPHLAVAAITAWIGIYYYDSFPEQIVMQTDLQGNPTNIVDKTYMTVLWPVILQLFMIGTFWIVNYSIAASKQQIDAANPQVSLQQSIIFRRKWSGFLMFAGFLLVVLFGFISLQQLLEFDIYVMLAGTLVITAFILFGSIRLSFMTGQGGSRIKIAGGQAASQEVNRDDDRYWKLGVIYFNPQDPTLFLEKRFGVGWTINFARPLAWMIFLLPIVFAIVMIVLIE